MSERIMINPVTRISGFMSIEVMVENHKVIDARVKGLMFRGFELMMRGRSPLDAIYYTQRICGICSAAHGLASTLALEDAFGVIPSDQGRFLRDFMHGCEYLQNHLRHFYQFTVPDFVKMPEAFQLFKSDGYDYRIPREKNDLIAKHYFESLNHSRNAHEMVATFGGKAPHNHGIFVGGATTQANSSQIIRVRSILAEISSFIENKMIPDAATIAHYYPEYYQNGQGHGNMMSYGVFDNYPGLGTLYLDPMAEADGQTGPLHTDRIREEIDFSWYADPLNSYSPLETVPTDDQNKEQAYSFIKAPRLDGKLFETGPLARLWLTGEYRHGISTMDRTVARVYEAKKITGILSILLDNILLNVDSQGVYDIPSIAEGAGLIDTTRGALGHWLKIGDQQISRYQVIAPSVWNLSSHGNDGTPGTGEQALIGAYIEDEENPVELARIIRSFDPCVSCATHVFYPDREPKIISVIP